MFDPQVTRALCFHAGAAGACSVVPGPCPRFVRGTLEDAIGAELEALEEFARAEQQGDERRRAERLRRGPACTMSAARPSGATATTGGAVDERVLLSRLVVSRRRALGLGGTLGLSGLLAACSGSGGTTPAASPSATGSGGAAAEPSVAASARTAAGADTLAALDRAGTCRMTRELTQGPYWFDVDSIRSDVREGRPGTTLALALRVQDVTACAAGGAARGIPDAVVEIWHCDAGGVYSGFESGSQGGPGRDVPPPGGPPPGGPGAPPGPPGQLGGEGPGSAANAAGGTSDGSYSLGDIEAEPTDDGTYLRGAQVTDGGGVAQFMTIYPGWYRGRTPHVHLKVHRDWRTVLTGQVFFDDAVTDRVYAAPPYSSRPGREPRNDADGIFDPAGVLVLSRSGDGYLGVLNLGVAG